MYGKSDKSRHLKKHRERPRRNGRCGSTLQTLAAMPPALPINNFDPELLYVECARCGAPVVWEKGRISQLLEKAGIDPFELDAACLLMTDSCQLCGQGEEYSIRIFRLTDSTSTGTLPILGHA